MFKSRTDDKLKYQHMQEKIRSSKPVLGAKLPAFGTKMSKGFSEPPNRDMTVAQSKKKLGRQGTNNMERKRRSSLARTLDKSKSHVGGVGRSRSRTPRDKDDRLKSKSGVQVGQSQLLLDGSRPQPNFDSRDDVSPGFNPTPVGAAEDRLRQSNPHRISVNVNKDQEYKGNALNDSIVEETPAGGEYRGSRDFTSSIQGYQGPGYGRESDLVNHFGKTPGHVVEEENRI